MGFSHLHMVIGAWPHCNSQGKQLGTWYKQLALKWSTKAQDEEFSGVNTTFILGIVSLPMQPLHALVCQLLLLFSQTVSSRQCVCQSDSLTDYIYKNLYITCCRCHLNQACYSQGQVLPRILVSKHSLPNTVSDAFFMTDSSGAWCPHPSWVSWGRVWCDWSANVVLMEQWAGPPL